MRTLDVGIDVDNVVYPWTSVFTRWVEKRKGMAPGTLDDIALSWTWYKDQWGMDTSEFMEHYTSGVHAGVIFAHGDPDPGSVTAIRRLHLDGHRIHYVTNREIPGVTADHAWTATHRWLHEHGFVVDSITVSPDKGVVPTDVFLDDSVDNIRDLLSAGHRWPLLWDRHHNRRENAPMVTTPRGTFRHGTRIHDWPGFLLVVDAVANLDPLSHES